MGTVKGIDISNNNGSVDLASVKNAGADYVYVKATEGRTFRDSYMDGFYNKCKSLSLKVGAYHFLVSSSNPEAQADNFYNKIKDYNWDLIPMLDVETMSGFTTSSLGNYVVRFIARFRSLSSLDIGIYTYTSFIGNLSGVKSSIKDLKLWEANYNNKPWVLPSNFFTTRVGHQYGEHGRIGNFKGDVNEFTEGCLVSGSIAGQWIFEQGKWWYKHNDGSYTANGWEKIDGQWYLFDKDGWMLYSWQYSNGGNWYYLGREDDGAMKTGWILLDNNWYYMNEDGAMQVGWEKIKDDWYYFDKSGVMQTGWIVDDNKNYLLYSDGKMAHDTVIYGYKFDSNGVATKI